MNTAEATTAPTAPAIPGSYAIPETPANEQQRLQALHSYRILDTEREQAYDELTTLAAVVCGTSMAKLSFVAEDRQWFKSAIGMPESFTQTPREIAFCAHAIAEPDRILEVPDTLLDPRFQGNPLVTTELKIRFHAAVPLLSSEGQALGALCVMERKPHSLNEHSRAWLLSLAHQVQAQLELRRIILERALDTESDPCTGALKRQAFVAALTQQWNDHAKEDASLSLLLVDADLDSYVGQIGRPVSPQILQQLAAAVRSPLRLRDVIGLPGGGQFAVLLHHCTLQSAAQIAEEVKQKIESERWPDWHFRVSIGIAAMRPTRDLQPQALLARAAHALEVARRSTRSRIEPFVGWLTPQSGRAAARLFVPYVPKDVAKAS